MATMRLTLGTVLDTVSTTANSVTGILNTVNNSVAMANRYVEEASENQRIRQKADRLTFVDGLRKEKAEELARSNKRIEEMCSKDEVYAKHYAAAYDLFGYLLADEIPKSAESHLKMAAE
jgi:predicted ATPase